MGMFFNFLDRVAESQRMPLKVRFFAHDVQKSISPEAQKIDTLLSENRLDEAEEIASSLPESNFSRVMGARVSGRRMHLHDEKVRAEHAARHRVEETEEARERLRSEMIADAHPKGSGVREDHKSPIAHEQTDDLGPER